MRRLTLKQRLRLARHAANSQESRLHWKEWRRVKRGGVPTKKVQIFAEGKRVRVSAREGMALPRVFCLDQNLQETLKFVDHVRAALFGEAVEYRRREEIRRKRAMSRPPSRRKTRTRRTTLRVYYDFKSLRIITPTAALILAALFDRRKAITGIKPITVDEHLWNSDVLQVLRSVGFHELLEMRPEKSDDPVSGQSIRILKFVSGEQVAGPELGRLQEALVQFLPEDERDRLLYAEPYAGMIEAALNSYTWAYPKDHVWDFPTVPRWWITGAIDPRNKTATVAVYDQGISIPASLPLWGHWSKVERMAKRLRARAGLAAPLDDPSNDATAIRLAMTVARSKTGLPQHGKGLNTMVEVVQRASAGRLRIISRNGEYIWEKGKKPIAISHPFSIGGTLIEWRLEL
ncbi:MAG: hypothetical protein ABSA68_13875 [Xanthobacteraceae bacterium]|jgi:hypothetical protein